LPITSKFSSSPGDKTVTRRSLGLPEDWSTLEEWAKQPFNFGPPIQDPPERTENRFAGINFRKKLPAEFWSQFQKNELPKKPSTKINAPQLKKEIEKVEHSWTIHQKEAAATALKNLSEGAPAHQKSDLPGAILRNAASAHTYGPEVTANLEKWLKEGYLAGPFTEPPLPDFRANSIMAVEQHQKVRLILNMSYPKDTSFNDNVDKASTIKVTMSSAKQFGQSLLRAGKGAIMSKLDQKDAYKQIPAKIKDLRLQGICWGGAYFVETQQIFGSSSSVSNYDIVAKTVQDIAISASGIKPSWVHRTLDDTAVVAPEHSGQCEKFTNTYEKLCQRTGVRLAADCPFNEKAFRNKTEGTVLGIRFNSQNLEWSISHEKAANILSDIHLAATCGHMDLKQMEELHGRLDNFGQMCPFLQAYKRPMNDFLAAFNKNYSILLPVPTEMIEDLRVWGAAAMSSTSWSPIEDIVEMPPLDTIRFISDAAGGTGNEKWMGVASIGYTESDNIWFACTGRWPRTILSGQDEKGAAFASKTTMLETVGLLLPILTTPNTVAGRNIVLGVDNIAVFYAWKNRSAKGDLLASTLIRALHIVSAYLECRIFVEHVPRRSTATSVLADDLTRASTATAAAWNQLSGAMVTDMPAVVSSWLQNPTVNWQLGFDIVSDLKI